MRIPIAVAAILMCSGACHAELYSNARYGFSIDVPAIIAVGQEESDSGDGVRSHSKDGKAEFLAYAGFLVDENGNKVKFATEMKDRLKTEISGGSKVTLQKIDPKGVATMSGTYEDKIFYVRAILACHGAAIATYRLEYPQADKPKYDDVITSLNKNFYDNDGCK